MICPFIILSLVIHHVSSCELRILWQLNPCASDIQAIPNSTYLPPKNADCKFGAGTDLVMMNEDRTRIENVFQVKTLQEMLDCNATNPLNENPVIVNDTATIPLVSGNNFEFNLGDIYLISTSNGTLASAEIDKVGSGSCLSMHFQLSPMMPDCQKDCIRYQFWSLASELSRSCENEQFNASSNTTPTLTTAADENSLYPETATGITNGSRGGHDFVFSSTVICDAECILTVMVSLLLVLIACVCCSFLLILWILYSNLNRDRYRYKKNPEKKIQVGSSISKNIKDPEKGSQNIGDNTRRYQKEEAKVITQDLKKVRLVSPSEDVGSVMKLPECRTQKSSNETASASDILSVSKTGSFFIPSESNLSKSAQSVEKEISGIQSPIQTRLSPIVKGAKRLLPRMRNPRNSPKVSPSKTIV